MLGTDPLSCSLGGSVYLACVSWIWAHFGFICVRDPPQFLLWCDVVCYFLCMNRVSRSVVAVCAVASLLVAGVGVSPVSAKTVNGCVIKAKTK